MRMPLAIQPVDEFDTVKTGAVISCDHDIAFCVNSAQSRLRMAGGSLCFELTKSPPCAWWRFWQWALLGWRWSDLREADER